MKEVKPTKLFRNLKIVCTVVAFLFVLSLSFASLNGFAIPLKGGIQLPVSSNTSTIGPGSTQPPVSNYTSTTGLGGSQPPVSNYTSTTGPGSTQTPGSEQVPEFAPVNLFAICTLIMAVFVLSMLAKRQKLDHEKRNTL